MLFKIHLPVVIFVHKNNKFGYLIFFVIFKAINDSVSEEVKESLKRHMWYLTEECVPFALFDKDLVDEQKREIADALLRHPRPDQFAPQKPYFQLRNLQQDDVNLASFIGQRSWLLFHLLGNTGAWVRKPVPEWEDDPEFIVMAGVVSDFAVVNDTAERGVKDVEEYANSANDSDKRGRIILVSNSHRMRLPEFKKNEMENNI